MILIFILTLVFLGVISAILYLSEHKSVSKRLQHNPWIYSLSIAGFAGMWAMFGTLQLAEDNGFMYLSYFLGTSVVFILAPLFLQPLATLSQTYHLHSLADLLSFRYNSQFIGIIVTIVSLFGVLPLMAMQLLTLSKASNFLPLNSAASSSDAEMFTIIITCICIGLFTLINLRRSRLTKNQPQGLACTIAALSVFKLLVFVGIAIFFIVTIFGSFSKLEHWLYIQPDKLMILNDSQQTNHARSLLLIFFTATLAMPHMFYLAFSERATPQAIRQSSWLFPSFLLILSLPILPFIWLKEFTGLQVSAELTPFALGQFLQTPAISILMYLAALAAITSSISLICLSLSGMFNNHIILPLLLRSKRLNITDNTHIYFQGTIVSIILLFAMFAAIAANNIDNLNLLGFASYTALLQFLPSILAVMYWPKANRNGLHYSLAVGLGCWFISTALPLISQDAFGLRPWLQQVLFFDQENYWFLSAISSLGLNMLTLGFVSVITRTSEDQKYIANVCAQNEIGKPIKRQLLVDNTQQIIDKLKKVLGQSQASDIVEAALQSLNMQSQEQRPFALRLLRRQIESNLSALYGPTVARRIVDSHIPYGKQSNDYIEDQQIIEFRLEQAKNNLSGLAAELDGMRRRHQKTIENLPIGVCTFSPDNEIIIWNSSLAHTTKIASSIATGLTLEKLPTPWNNILVSFVESDEFHIAKKEISIQSQPHWFNFHKGNNDDDVHTILIEDVSQLAQLESEWLHHERLATIGRLAAGVAHEIGNPVTGIACLAQNLKYDSDNPDVDASAKDILIQTDRITKIVQSLVNFSHAGNQVETDKLVLEPVHLSQCLNEAINLLALKDRTILDKVHNNLDPNLTINGNIQGLQQIFLNLIQNAAQACQHQTDTVISIQASQDDFTLTLRVTDNGPGIKQEIQSTIFEPFVTTKGSEEGTGLGLAIVYSIVEEHHGDISVTCPNPDTQQGCVFTINLPLN
ncbi:MAG: GHKL domain-containing protein [Sinobacterium sp.]|nr:GHKL domain-containing protein [Sinobacterium sp.]